MTTILLLVSRSQYLDAVFACLEFLNCDSKTTNILVIVDGDNELYVTTRNKVENSKFNDRLCVQYKSEHKLMNFNIMNRRIRIAAIHNFAKQFIKQSEYILSIEDDTTFKPDTLTKLLYNYSILPFAGMISGVQLGRHGILHVGGWKLDDIYTPDVITSVDLGKGIAEVDGCGLYCALIKADHYLSHEFKPFEDVLGPDSNFGIELRRQGLKNYMDFSIICQHHVKDSIISPITTETQIVTFIKKEGAWRQKSLA